MCVNEIRETQTINRSCYFILFTVIIPILFEHIKSLCKRDEISVYSISNYI